MDGYTELARAAIIQALRDLQRGNANNKRAASLWLQSNDAALFFHVIGLDQSRCLNALRLRGLIRDAA